MNSSGFGTNTLATLPQLSADKLAFENLLRRELKVGDPANPYQVAEALINRYRDDPRARAIRREAQGLPFSSEPIVTTPLQVGNQASDREWQQAVDDVMRDTEELTTSALLKDVSVELTGWSQAIQTTMREGDNAARFALDPSQRDKAFGMRRQLTDYARVSRMVGALSPDATAFYRQLARSLDEASAVILVRMGEALANAGLNGGRFLLQAPYTELQVRRDAVIYALRNLVGSTHESSNYSQWPRGLDAYRRLFKQLEAQGQGDLRSLLVEHELGRVMDELIQRAQHGTPDGLRALGATAQLDLARFRRLASTGAINVSPESPALTTFLEAMRLFAEAFDTSGGFRLLRIARSPVLQYGLYGGQNLRPAEQRLLTLVGERSRYAALTDCLADCACGAEARELQLAADKALHSLDCAIDLYALGTADDFGTAESRASGHAYVLGAVIRRFTPGCAACPGVPDALKDSADSITDALERIVPSLLPKNFNAFLATPEHMHLREQEICAQSQQERSWRNLVGALTVGCPDDPNVFEDGGVLEVLSSDAIYSSQLKALPGVLLTAKTTKAHVCPDDDISLPPALETLFDQLINHNDATGRRPSLPETTAGQVLVEVAPDSEVFADLAGKIGELQSQVSWLQSQVTGIKPNPIPPGSHELTDEKRRQIMDLLESAAEAANDQDIKDKLDELRKKIEAV